MYRPKARGLVLFLCMIVSTSGLAYADIPLTINHQGIVRVNGAPFTGSGLFKFGFYDAGTNNWLWTNDGSQVGSNVINKPTNPFSLTVSNGVYNVLLGDTTIINMVAIPSSVFDGSNVKLRVIFNDGSTGEQVLSPDQPISSAAYAYRAALADESLTFSGLSLSELRSFFKQFGGDGSDGLRTVSTTPQDLGAAIRQYTTLDVQAAGTLVIDQGWGIIGVQGTCTIDGTITAEGAGEAGGAGGVTLTGPTGTKPGHSALGHVSAEAVSLCLAGAGGGGGGSFIDNNSGKPGGGGGSKGGGEVIQTIGEDGTPTDINRFDNLLALKGIGINAFLANLLLYRGAGGGGAAFNAVTPSAAGGTGGGVIYIECNELVFTGTLNAAGGAGENRGGTEGGGGGGGGGVILVRAKTITTDTGTLNVSGGVGGTGLHVGGNGASGYSIILLVD